MVPPKVPDATTVHRPATRLYTRSAICARKSIMRQQQTADREPLVVRKVVHLAGEANGEEASAAAGDVPFDHCCDNTSETEQPGGGGGPSSRS
jgi:hypothetical protein